MFKVHMTLGQVEAADGTMADGKLWGPTGLWWSTGSILIIRESWDKTHTRCKIGLGP